MAGRGGASGCFSAGTGRPLAIIRSSIGRSSMLTACAGTLAVETAVVVVALAFLSFEHLIAAGATVGHTNRFAFNQYRLLLLQFLSRMWFMVNKFMNNLHEPLAPIGAAVLKELHRLAIQPVGQFLDGLHIAPLALGYVDLGDCAQFFHVL